MPANTQLPHRLRTTWQLPWYFPQPRTNLKFHEISNKFHNFPTTKKTNKANKNTTLQGFIFVITEGLGPPKQIQALLPALRTFRCSHGGLEHWCTGWKAYVVKTGLWCGQGLVKVVVPKLLLQGYKTIWSTINIGQTISVTVFVEDVLPANLPSKQRLDACPPSSSEPAWMTLQVKAGSKAKRTSLLSHVFEPVEELAPIGRSPATLKNSNSQMNSSKLNTFLIAQIVRSKPVHKPLTILPL